MASSVVALLPVLAEVARLGFDLHFWLVALLARLPGLVTLSSCVTPLIVEFFGQLAAASVALSPR